MSSNDAHFFDRLTRVPKTSNPTDDHPPTTQRPLPPGWLKQSLQGYLGSHLARPPVGFPPLPGMQSPGLPGRKVALPEDFDQPPIPKGGVLDRGRGQAVDSAGLQGGMSFGLPQPSLHDPPLRSLLPTATDRQEFVGDGTSHSQHAPVLYDLGPQYRHGPAVPAGRGIAVNGQRFRPEAGPCGHGVYVPSTEAGTIDFYPVHGARLRSQSQGATPNPPAHPPSGSGQPTFVPFVWEAPGPEPDLVDPKFREMLAQIMLLSKDNLGSVMDKERLGLDIIGPMAMYIKTVPGRGAMKLHEQLVTKCRELGIGEGLDCMKKCRVE